MSNQGNGQSRYVAGQPLWMEPWFSTRHRLNVVHIVSIFVPKNILDKAFFVIDSWKTIEYGVDAAKFKN